MTFMSHAEPAAPPLSSKSESLSNARIYAFRTFGIYCLIFYLFPATVIYFYGNGLDAVIRPEPDYLLGFAYVVFSFFLFKAALRLPIIRFPLIGQRLAQLAFDPHLSLFYAAFFVVFALATRSTLDLSFRQTGSALADVGAIGFIMQFLNIFFATSILVHYRMVNEKVDHRIRSKVLLLISAGFLFSIQASLDVLFVFCAFLASGMRWHRVLGLHLKLVRRAAIAVIPLVVLAALFVGTANKQGVERAFETLSNFDTIIAIFSSRLSYHFTSTSMHVTENFSNFGMFFDAIRNVGQTTLYRASVLMGFGGIEKPEVVSIARMNFLQLSNFWRDRTGTSPSILGSTFFLPGAGFAIIYYVLVIRGVALMIGRIMAPHITNVPFLLLSVITLGGVLDAALDNINPLSPGFIRVTFLYLGMVYVIVTLRNRKGLSV